MSEEEKEQWLYEEYKYTSNFDFNRLDKYQEVNDDICIDDIILDYTMLYEHYKQETERLKERLSFYESDDDIVLMSKEKYEEIKQELQIEKATNKELLSTGADLENKLYEEQDKNKRLNNIIDKAKIYCEDVIQEHENGDYDVDTTWLAIKEHKGNIKSVLNILNGDLENYWRSDKE